MRIQADRLYEVKLIESDRFSGQKVIDRQYYDTKEEADTVAMEVNAKNVSDTVPEYYIFATVD
jgi:hypothetical protein